jgi:hypothetical protein
MNIQQRPTEKTENRERQSPALRPGRWLIIARVGWGALTVFTLIVVVASLPVYAAHLHKLCAGTATVCAFSQQLSPAQARMLTGMGLSLGDYAAFTVALTLATVMVCLAVSALITWRRSHDRMALLVALMLVTLGPIIATNSVSANSSPWQVPTECLNFLAVALLVLVFLLFPSGQFVPSFTRWTLVACLVGQVPITFFRDAPFAVHTDASQVSSLLLIGEAAIVVGVQLYRYRRVSSLLERQQTKWVVFGLAVPTAVFVGGSLLTLVFPVLADPNSPSGSPYQLGFTVANTCTPLFIPLSFGFAMLHNRLWEIDVLINRTLVYGTLTVILTAVYAGLVIGLSALLRGLASQDNSVAIILSTLASAALFLPLRNRIQLVIDRRFYRRKYDAAKIVAAWSRTLQQEVDLDQLREQLLAVVQETMQPAFLSLWVFPLKQQVAEGETKRREQ